MGRFLTVDKIPKKVLLTDDPLRAAMISSHYLDNSRLVYENRGMRGYSGVYNGAEVAVISCGFGETSAQIYLSEAYETGAREFVYFGEAVSVSGKHSLMNLIIKTPIVGVSIYTNDKYFINGEVPQEYSLIDFAWNGLNETAMRLNAILSAVLVVTENALTGERIPESVRQSRLTEAVETALDLLVSGTE